MRTNQNRARAAFRATYNYDPKNIAYFGLESRLEFRPGGAGFDGQRMRQHGLPVDTERLEENITDLLADLPHLCAVAGIDFQRVLCRAGRHLCDERDS